MLKQIVKSIVGDSSKRSRSTVLRLRGKDYKSEKINGINVLVPKKYIEIGRSGEGEGEIFEIIRGEEAEALMNDAIQKSDMKMTKSLAKSRERTEETNKGLKEALLLFEERHEEMKRLEDEVKGVKNQVGSLMNSEK